MNVKHLGLIAVTAVVAAGLAGMSTSNAGAAVAAAPANCVIRTYSGNYVTAVGGGGRETDTLHTDATRIGSWERFALVPAGDGYVAIQTVDGHYLTAMGAGGWSTDSPSNPAFHTDATRIQAWEKFRLVPLPTGKSFSYAIETTQNWIWTAQGGGGREINVMTTGIGIGLGPAFVDTYEQFQVICGL
jgi:hypothetical protein